MPNPATTNRKFEPEALPGQEDYSTRPRIGAEGYDKGQALKKVGIAHDAIIDIMLARPRIEQKELAELFGYSKGWICRLVNSDAFQARMAQRKADLTDPGIARRINARLQGLTIQAVDTLSRKLDATDSAELALESLGLATVGLEKVKAV